MSLSYLQALSIKTVSARVFSAIVGTARIAFVRPDYLSAALSAVKLGRCDDENM